MDELLAVEKGLLHSVKIMSDKHIVLQELEHRLNIRLEDVQRTFERVAVLEWNSEPDEDKKDCDAVVSHLGATFVVNPPDYIFRAGKMLKPDGLFLASVLGVDSFKELRELSEAFQCVPLPDVRDVGAVLQKYGFALPVVDRDTLVLTFSAEAVLIDMLQQTGFDKLLGGVDWLKGVTLPRRSDGKIELTLDVLYLHGWFPAEGQPQPKKPGTATVKLSEIL